jgi:thiamine-phosphate pyrophosphorylase
VTFCPSLYAVVDADVCARGGYAPEPTAMALVQAGVRLLQVRGKTLGAAALLDLSRQVVDAAGPDGRVIVNDRPDIAVLAGAGGVHVGQDDVAAADARGLLGAGRWVGLSTHTVEQARRALDEPIDYIAIGPVFATGTKNTGYGAIGLDLVAEVSALARPRAVPIVAIGGITLDSAADVIAAGADSVCVISDLLKEDPGPRAEAFIRLLGPQFAGT